MRALKLTIGAAGRATPVELAVESGTALLQSLGTERPVAYVVRATDLDALRRLDEAVIDLGKRHPSKQLWQLLVGSKKAHKQQKVPIIDGNFKEAGRLRPALMATLDVAKRYGERLPYIIGVSGELFSALSDMEAKALRVARRRVMEPPAMGATEARWTDGLPQLPRVTIPDKLRDELYVGDAPQVQLVRQYIMLAAPSDQPVLIIGPTGTGKENVAKAIHELGPRAARPYKAVNIAAVTSTIFEAELFGTVRGAFTGAVNRKGLWEAAEDGTLFLDEIGDLDLGLQKKLLRAIDRNEIYRVGATEAIRVKARVVTATNRDLLAMTQTGRFRQDLYHRLLGIKIETPALCEHPEDIGMLATFLWRRIRKNPEADLAPDVIARLEASRWPGNVRELYQVLMNVDFRLNTDSPTLDNVELILAMQGHTPGVPPDGNSAHELRLYRAECLRHLRRTDELVRACEVTLEPIVERKRVDRAGIEAAHHALHYRLHELGLLCQTPLLFHSEVTFSVVHRLLGKLEYFHSLLQRRSAEAVRYFNKDVSPELKLALSAIFKEVERVMAGA